MEHPLPPILYIALSVSALLLKQYPYPVLMFLVNVSSIIETSKTPDVFLCAFIFNLPQFLV